MNLIYKLSLAVVVTCCSLPAKEEAGVQAANTIQAAQTIKIGDTREEVIKILGPATWAILPEDKDADGRQMLLPGKTLKLIWDVPNCVPIQVLFDGAYKVWGVGGGIPLSAFSTPEERKAVKLSDDFLAKDGQRLNLSCLHSEKHQGAEQGGADQPATAPESKSEGKDKPQPESKSAPR